MLAVGKAVFRRFAGSRSIHLYRTRIRDLPEPSKKTSQKSDKLPNEEETTFVHTSPYLFRTLDAER